MSWANFTHLTKPDTDQITVTGTGKAEKSAASGKALRPVAAETKSGGPAGAAPAEVTKFLSTQQRAVRFHKLNPDLRMQPWFNQAIKDTDGKNDAFLGKAVEQLSKGLNENSIVEAQDVFNEISRTPEKARPTRKASLRN